MNPVIQRVSQRVGNRLSPGQKLLIRLDVARAEAFGNTVCPHGAPFVVVALQPDFEQIAEPAVFGQIFGGKMAVIVEYRLRCRILLVEVARSLTLLKKMFRYKSHVPLSILT